MLTAAGVGNPKKSTTRRGNSCYEKNNNKKKRDVRIRVSGSVLSEKGSPQKSKSPNRSISRLLHTLTSGSGDAVDLYSTPVRELSEGCSTERSEYHPTVAQPHSHIIIGRRTSADLQQYPSTHSATVYFYLMASGSADLRRSIREIVRAFCLQIHSSGVLHVILWMHRFRVRVRVSTASGWQPDASTSAGYPLRIFLSRGGGGWGVYPIFAFACLSHLTIHHASLSRRGIVPTPNSDTSNSWALISSIQCAHKALGTNRRRHSQNIVVTKFQAMDEGPFNFSLGQTFLLVYCSSTEAGVCPSHIVARSRTSLAFWIMVSFAGFAILNERRRFR